MLTTLWAGVKAQCKTASITPSRLPLLLPAREPWLMGMSSEHCGDGGDLWVDNFLYLGHPFT